MTWNSCNKKAPPRQVVLITIDTLRADRLGCYGYDKNTSPRIDEFADESILFLNPTSQVTYTPGSFASMFTGRPYSEALTNGESLNPKLDYLAEILKKNGLSPVAVLSNYTLAALRGFSRGFDKYLFYSEKRLIDRNKPKQKASKANPHHNYKVPANIINDRTLEQLPDLKDKDFFLWILYLDPHKPFYAHPPKYYDGPSPLQGDFELNQPIDLPPLPSLRQVPGLDERQLIFPKPSKGKEYPGNPEDVIPAVHYYYDGEVRFVDDHVGRLIDELKRSGIYDNALTILTSDHGESLFDHNYFYGHGREPYQDQVHVPFIIHWPDQEPAIVDQPVSLMDLVPTILEFLDIDPPQNIRGSVLTHTGRTANHPIIAQSPGLKHHSIREGDYKLLVENTKPKESLYLFNVKDDPNETKNLIDVKPEIGKRLLDNLNATKVTLTPAPQNIPTPAIDDALKNKLRALGYME